MQNLTEFAGRLAWLALHMVYVWVCVQYKCFYSVLSHTVPLFVVEVPLPVTLCRVCNVGMTIPPVGRGELVSAHNCLVNYLILVLWRGQNAHHLFVWVILYDHLQMDSPSYSFTPNRPEALLGWYKAQRNRLFYLIIFFKLQQLSCLCPLIVPTGLLQKSWCSVSPSRTQMQEWPEHKWVLEKCCWMEIFLNGDDFSPEGSYLIQHLVWYCNLAVFEKQVQLIICDNDLYLCWEINL